MAEIVGSSSNNPYGIRNDVFDFITQDINDLNTPEFNDVKLKNIIYNKVKSDFLKIKYFRDTSKVIIIENKSQVIYECIFINDSDALMELHFSWHSEYGYGRLENVIYKTDDLEAINDRISDITNDRFMNHRLKEKFLNQNLDICNLFLDDVLSEEEFLKPNIEIEKMYDK